MRSFDISTSDPESIQESKVSSVKPAYLDENGRAGLASAIYIGTAAENLSLFYNKFTRDCWLILPVTCSAAPKDSVAAFTSTARVEMSIFSLSEAWAVVVD